MFAVPDEGSGEPFVTVRVVCMAPVSVMSTSVNVPKAELNIGNDKLPVQSVNVYGIGVDVVKGPEIMSAWTDEATPTVTTAKTTN